MKTYDPKDWYWLVAETGEYWSSALDIYLSALPDGEPFTHIDTEQNLTDVLLVYGIAGPIQPPYRLFKSVFISRLDDQANEPEIMEATLAAAPAKLRLLFNSVEYFVSDDPLFLELYEAIETVLGPYRATQLLEPES